MNRLHKVALIVSAVALVPLSAFAASGGPAAACPGFGSLERLGSSDGSMGLREASGILASRRNPGVFWTHNDNAGKNELFALDADGTALAKFWLKGVSPVSFEDISFGPGRNDGDAIWLGDIGDNRDARPEVGFFRFDEPWVDLGWRAEERPIEAAAIDVFRVAYREPGTPRTWGRDSEAFFVDPTSGDLFVFEKKFNHIDGDRLQSWVYRVPSAQLVPDRLLVAEPVTHVTSRVGNDGSSFTAADISSDGSLILVKNMFELFVWPRTPGTTVAEVLAQDPVAPCTGPAEVGEAIGILPDVSAFVMMREGTSSPLWQVSIRRPTPTGQTTTTTTPPATAPPTTAPPTTAPPTTAPSTTAPPTTAPPTTAPPTTVPPTTVPPIVGAGTVTCHGLVPTIIGSRGNDVLIGSNGPDVILGADGDDVIYGHGGDDVICGGRGDDLLRGGNGDDRILAGGGDDMVYGGGGDDILRGHAGRDVVDGGEGRDVAAGNLGNDILINSGGRDMLVGGEGNDSCLIDDTRTRTRSCETSGEAP